MWSCQHWLLSEHQALKLKAASLKAFAVHSNDSKTCPRRAKGPSWVMHFKYVRQKGGNKTMKSFKKNKTLQKLSDSHCQDFENRCYVFCPVYKYSLDLGWCHIWKVFRSGPCTLLQDYPVLMPTCHCIVFESGNLACVCVVSWGILWQ